jgi:hypothetical protein
MPDIQIFDAASFFDQKIQETGQALISKRAEAAILVANLRSLARAFDGLKSLPEEHQRALAVEVASMNEVRSSTRRALESLETEIEVLSVKLSALQAARDALQVSTEAG